MMQTKVRTFGLVLSEVVVHMSFINLFHATGLFLYPLKTSENKRFSDVSGVIERDQWHEKG